MFTDKKYYEGLACRFSIFNKNIKPFKTAKTIWIHTVSVGEFLTSIPIINMIKQEYPDINIVITTTTKTGNAIARKRLKDKAIVLYSPIDLSIIIKRFLKLINPCMLIIMETELWPNLIKTTKKQNIPILLLNARISDKSFKNYFKVKFFFKKVLSCIDCICVQSNQDKERLIKIGTENKKLLLTGNIKFDIIPDKIIDCNFPIDKENKIFIAGSTHEGEEEYILNAFKHLKEKGVKCKIIIAPRHPERISKVESLINSYKLSYIKRSQIQSNNKSADIILIDTIGELFSLYSIADLVFIGGSLIPHGGHNILEPAYFKKPIIFGQYMNNFKEITELFLKNNAAIMIKNQNNLNHIAFTLLSDPSLRKDLSQKTETVLNQNQGASKKSFNIIKEFL